MLSGGRVRAPFAVILGAGLAGQLLAHVLSQAGQRVELYDASGPGGQGAAARVAAAMLAPLAESAIADIDVVRMGQYSLPRWPALLATLRRPVYFQQLGTLVLWHRQDGAEAQRFAHQLRAAVAALPTLAPATELDTAGVAALEPSLGDRFARGLFLPGEGQLDNRALLASLQATLIDQGVATHWNCPRTPQDFAGVPAWVVDCRGLGARPQWGALRGVRGEVIRLHAPEVQLSRPTRLLHPRYPLYIAPKPDGVFVVGATEIESEDFSPVSTRSALELLSAAYTVHSGFAEGRVLEMSSQCRPALPDNRPSLRRLAPRVLQINGLYRHGFMIGPAMVDAAAELLLHGTESIARQLRLTIDAA